MARIHHQGGIVVTLNLPFPTVASWSNQFSPVKAREPSVFKSLKKLYLVFSFLCVLSSISSFIMISTSDFFRSARNYILMRTNISMVRGRVDCNGTLFRRV